MSGALPPAASVVSVSNCMYGLACKADQVAWAWNEQEGKNKQEKQPAFFAAEERRGTELKDAAACSPLPRLSPLLESLGGGSSLSLCLSLLGSLFFSYTGKDPFFRYGWSTYFQFQELRFPLFFSLKRAFTQLVFH